MIPESGPEFRAGVRLFVAFAVLRASAQMILWRQKDKATACAMFAAALAYLVYEYLRSRARRAAG